MQSLFRIETDRITLDWSEPRGGAPAALAGTRPGPGLLIIEPKRNGLEFGPNTYRQSLSANCANDPYQRTGPRLFEQTDYTVSIRSKNGLPIRVEHRDPFVLHDLKRSVDSAYGVINYGSQVGLSTFRVWVGNEEELRFTVEVFPSKLDYQNDYQQILAEIRETLIGLALEYLRSTFRLGAPERSAEPSNVEWMGILRFIVDELERALQFIAARPQRGVTRAARSVRVETVRRVDAALRRTVIKQSGVGDSIALGGGVVLRRQIDERRSRVTLDTPEHRWIAGQLIRIRRQVAMIRQVESSRPMSPRIEKTVAELDLLESRLARMIRLEPFTNSRGAAPPGFVSLHLMASPGYQEAYRLCLVLSLGLRLTGDVVELS